MKTKFLRSYNGPEFTSHEFQSWATQKGIRIEYIQPGKPQQNAYIERYNRTVRYGLLNQYLGSPQKTEFKVRYGLGNCFNGLNLPTPILLLCQR